MSFLARSVVQGLAARSAFNGSWTGAWEAHGSTHGSIGRQERNGTYTGVNLYPQSSLTRPAGGSPWGTMGAPHLPNSVGQPPWGDHDPHNPFGMPDTGATREYDFTVTYQDIAPDGVTKRGVVVNGQYPGPMIEANWHVSPLPRL